jgi:hypothetical protein
MPSRISWPQWKPQDSPGGRAQGRHPGRVSPGLALHDRADSRARERQLDGREKRSGDCNAPGIAALGMTQRASRPRARELDSTPCTMSRSTDGTPWAADSIQERTEGALAPSTAAPGIASVGAWPSAARAPTLHSCISMSPSASRVGPRKTPLKAERHHPAEDPKKSPGSKTDCCRDRSDRAAAAT